MMLQLKKLMHKSLLIIAGTAFLAFSSITVADNTDVAKAKTDKCVADTAYMRTNHMSEIQHQRDDTMRKGIRGGDFSLKECINCHVEEDSKARYGDNDHFCSGCHNYTAVTVDCFQCHADRPTKAGKTGYKASINTSKNPHIADTKSSADDSNEGVAQ
jgi:hypothetical protein